MSQTFGVNLRGVIDLLSHHLYSSPRVYLRELLQNAVDAITARRLVDPDAPAEVLIEPMGTTGDRTLRVTDTGIGLTEREVHELLSTLGQTSKRDELGFARKGFLGQFGVGMLSCFLVAERINLVTRSAGGGQAVRWSADSSGSYQVELLDDPTIAIGTVVELVAAPDQDHWLEHDLVRSLVTEYGELLPASVRVAPGTDTVTRASLPWERAPGMSTEEFQDQLAEYGKQVFGFTPFEAIPVHVPAADLTGVAFVLPDSVHPGTRQTHRVYLKRMLVGDSVEGLLPDWAYFVRCVLDSSSLRPTASREALYQDETLLSVREAIGGQIRDWLVRLEATEPERTTQLLNAHHLGIKSLARVDDEMLRLVERWLPFESTEGPMPLRQFRRKHGTALFVPSVEEFRQLAPVAQAQGIGLLNAGYAYDVEVLQRLVEVDGPTSARRVAPSELLAALGDPEPEMDRALRAALAHAGDTLLRHDCDAVLREFDPVSLPALLITNAEQERRSDAEQVSEQVDPVWAELLGQLTDGPSGAGRQLILNCRNPLVRKLAGMTDPVLAELTVESLYVHALLQAGRPMRPRDTAALNRSFLGLLDRAVRD